MNWIICSSFKPCLVANKLQARTKKMNNIISRIFSSESESTKFVVCSVSLIIFIM